QTIIARRTGSAVASSDRRETGDYRQRTQTGLPPVSPSLSDFVTGGDWPDSSQSHRDRRRVASSNCCVAEVTGTLLLPSLPLRPHWDTMSRKMGRAWASNSLATTDVVRLCRKRNAKILADAPEGLCTACLFETGLDVLAGQADRVRDASESAAAPNESRRGRVL